MEIRRGFLSGQPTITDSMYDLNTIVGITQNLDSIKSEERREENIATSIKRLNKLKYRLTLHELIFSKLLQMRRKNIYDI